jgi:hypothetical protein
VYLSMIRALARDLGRDEQAASVRVPRHESGPPETLTDTDYANLLHVPDRRTIAGKRDYEPARGRRARPRGLRAARARRPTHHRPLRRLRPERIDEIA